MSNKRKSIFFIADQHYHHTNCINFDKRPFRDLEHMHSSLIKRHNSVVPEDGICYFLGDVGMSSASEMKDLISKLNGTKVLVSGNHDKGHNAMYNIGFDVVTNRIDIFISGERVTLTHCPLRGIFREDITGMRNAVEGDNWHGESKHDRFSAPNEGQFCLHGHLHKRNDKPPVKLGRQWDVGVCGNSFTPVSISKVESWIAKVKKEEKLIENSKNIQVQEYRGFLSRVIRYIRRYFG